jgi:outer membrane protein assembly factor BamB
MKKVTLALSLALMVFAMTNAEAAQPVVSSLSSPTVARSGRLLIYGSGFGAPGPTSLVEIGGLRAPVTRWSDDLIAAYVPEAAPLGTVMLTIVGAGSTTSVPFTVTLRESNGRVKWRFQADADYILQRPAIAPDGTVVAHDSNGHVYALAPDGALKWIVSTPPFAAGPPSVGPDGTVYVASSGTIEAINPDGSLKWEFSDPLGGQGVMAGPTVGPDGNVYAVTDIGGLGALALSPDGLLLWGNAGDPPMQEYGQTGVEIAFGPSRSGGPVDQIYVAFDDFTTAPSSRLYAFRTSGEQAWVAPLYLSKDTLGMFHQQQPEVGPDGTVFLPAAVSTGASWSMNGFSAATGVLSRSYFPSPGTGVSVPAIGPDGRVYFVQSLSYLQSLSATFSPKWQYFDGSILLYPVVSPANDIVFTGGMTGYGMPGFARAFSVTKGALLWSLDLGVVNGGNQVMQSVPRFDPAGGTVYFGTSVTGSTSSDTSCYLYALDTTATAPPSAPGRVRSLSVGMNADGHSLDLSWEPSCSGTATDYEVMEGTIGAWNEYAPLLCSTGGATSVTLTPFSGSSFYLIVPRSATLEGSYGLDPNGNERPRSAPQCVATQVAGGCP